jgi:hypothetical protein
MVFTRTGAWILRRSGIPYPNDSGMAVRKKMPVPGNAYFDRCAPARQPRVKNSVSQDLDGRACRSRRLSKALGRPESAEAAVQ